MIRYISNTPDDELDLGVILMERVRNILTTKHIVAHNGTFEWKVGYHLFLILFLPDTSSQKVHHDWMLYF